MKIELEINKKDLALLRGFLNNSYDNWYHGIDHAALRKSEIKKEEAQLGRIRKAFAPVFEETA